MLCIPRVQMNQAGMKAMERTNCQRPGQQHNAYVRRLHSSISRNASGLDGDGLAAAGRPIALGEKNPEIVLVARSARSIGCRPKLTTPLSAPATRWNEPLLVPVMLTSQRLSGREM